MNLLKLIFVAFALAFGSFVSFSFEYKIDKTVAKQPTKIIFDHRSAIHIFCLGQDINYDGIIDLELGDEHPSWWTANGTDDPIKKHDLSFSPKSFLGFPFEPGVDLGHSKDGVDAKLYLFQDKWLLTYSLYDQELLDSLELKDPIASIYYNDNKLYLSRVVEDGGPAYVFIKDISTKNYEYIDTLVLNIRPKRLLAFDNSTQKYLAVIDEGNFGANDSKLFIFNNIDDHDFVKSIDLGDGANHITENDDFLVVTVNGSSNIVLIDKESLEIVKTIPIPVSNPYNGPREAIVGNFKTFVSSYDGKLFVLDLESGTIESDTEYDGKTEGMAYDPNSDILFVASISQKDSYSPDNKYSIFSTLSSAESEINFDFDIYPNPTKDLLVISLSETIDDYSISLMDINGRTVADLGKFSDNNINVNLSNLNLATGKYYLVLKTKTYLKAVPVVYNP